MDAYRKPDRSHESPLVYDYAIAVERQRRQAKIFVVVLAVGGVAYALLTLCAR